MANHDHQHSHGQTRERLKFAKTPVVDDATTHTSGTKHDTDKDGFREEGIPQLKRYEEPTLLEIFYDLFFAANYSVFSENREVTNHASFKAYIGYFCLLWLTWFLVATYDVRFITDSIFERAARALQLGVLVGFTVVAPIFDPSDQNAQTMRTMSLILMFSRAILAVEYASTLWHVRSFRKSRVPLYFSISINIVAMLIYLGITFRFKDGEHSRVYMTWYFISGAEGIATLAMSYFWSVLSFTKTHLMKRLTLITVMILGDGLVNIAKEVVTMVKTPQAWDPLTIGLITAGVATIYFVFLIYFDWLRSSFYLPPVRQISWTALHLPFHLSLVLFMQAFTQYIIWSKVMHVLDKITKNYLKDGSIDDRFSSANVTSVEISDYFKNRTDAFFSQYPAKTPQIQETVTLALVNLTSLPNSLWSQLEKLVETEDENAISTSNQDAFATFIFSINSIQTSLINNLFQAFGIDLSKDIIQPAKNVTGGKNGAAMLQNQVTSKTWRRYRLVFAYGYIAAGCCLLLMAILSIISRTTRWKPWPIIRLIILIILALGTGLVSLLWFTSPSEKDEDEDLLLSGEDACFQYISTPWVLLTIFIVFTIVLVLTHIGGDGDNPRQIVLFSWFKKKPRYESVNIPLTHNRNWSNENPKVDQVGIEGRRDREASHELQQTDELGVEHERTVKAAAPYGSLQEFPRSRSESHV